jgi:hypothetical protein
MELLPHSHTADQCLVNMKRVRQWRKWVSQSCSQTLAANFNFDSRNQSLDDTNQDGSPGTRVLHLTVAKALGCHLVTLAQGHVLGSSSPCPLAPCYRQWTQWTPPQTRGWSCSMLKFNGSFEGRYRLHLQGRRISKARDRCETRRQAEMQPSTQHCCPLVSETVPTSRKALLTRELQSVRKPPFCFVAVHTGTMGTLPVSGVAYGGALLDYVRAVLRGADSSSCRAPGDSLASAW